MSDPKKVERLEKGRLQVCEKTKERTTSASHRFRACGSAQAREASYSGFTLPLSKARTHITTSMVKPLREQPRVIREALKQLFLLI